MIHLAAQPKTSDSIILSRPAVEKLLTAAMQKKVLDTQVVILNQRITEKENIINGLNSKDSTNKQIIQTYKDEIQTMKDQRGIYDAEITVLNKDIKKQKRKTFWLTVLGIAGTASATFLYITK